MWRRCGGGGGFDAFVGFFRHLLEMDGTRFGRGVDHTAQRAAGFLEQFRRRTEFRDATVIHHQNFIVILHSHAQTMHRMRRPALEARRRTGGGREEGVAGAGAGGGIVP